MAELPLTVTNEISAKAFELNKQARYLSDEGKALTAAWGKLIRQYRWWVTGNLWIRALTWLLTTTMPILVLWMILSISYDIRISGYTNTIRIELRDPPPSQGPRIAPPQRR